MVLTQILINAISQLNQLRAMVEGGRDSLNLVKDINKGINDSLRALQSLNPNIDPGVYRDWKNVDEVIARLREVYGIIVPSRDAQIQRDTDAGVADAVTLNNSIYEYTKQIDQIGEQVKSYSHAVSPGGAQKLTAQTLGVMLHVLNAGLRTQATGLKLQAQALAIQNKKDKESTRQMLTTTENLRTAMQRQDSRFSIPRF